MQKINLCIFRVESIRKVSESVHRDDQTVFKGTLIPFQEQIWTEEVNLDPDVFIHVMKM